MKDPYQKPEPEKVQCTATSRELTEDELDDVRAGYTPFGCYEERDTIIVILGSLIIDRVHKPLDATSYWMDEFGAIHFEYGKK